MSKVAILKSVVSQRLLAAVEEIFALIEGTIDEYEAENQRQRLLLESLANPPDVRLAPVIVEHSGLDQQPPSHFKEELSELSISPAPASVRAEDCSRQPELVGPEPKTEPDFHVDHPAEAELHTSSDEDDSDEDDSDDSAEEEAADKPFSCSRCDKKFTQSRYLKTHMTSHTRTKTFRCSLCGKRYMKKAYLIQHKASHKSCDVCQGRRGAECGLCRGGPSSAAKSFSCNICGRVFLQKGYLIKHMERLQGKLPFHCLLCKKNFCYFNTLKNHSCGGWLQPHPGEEANPETFPSPPYVPPHDDDDDELSGDSDSSSSSESPEKFSCSLCDKTFSSSANLRRHVRVHTGEKPFGCPICAKIFMMKAHLMRHMTSHKTAPDTGQENGEEFRFRQGGSAESTTLHVDF